MKGKRFLCGVLTAFTLLTGCAKGTAEDVLGETSISETENEQTKGTLLISINQILFLERKGRKTRIQTEDAEVQTTQPPQELLTTAPPEQFIRCHQSYWVQTQKILALKNNDFYLQNDYRIPLSRTSRQKAKEQFFASLKNLSLFNE